MRHLQYWVGGMNPGVEFAQIDPPLLPGEVEIDLDDHLSPVIDLAYGTSPGIKIEVIAVGPDDQIVRLEIERLSSVRSRRRS